MNADIKAQWVAALRSGDYKQTHGTLREGDAFCCLGVLCNLHAQAHPEFAAMQDSASVYMGAGAVLPEAVTRWAGLSDQRGNFVTIGRNDGRLAAHNDVGRTFAEIADAIEGQL